MVKAAALQKAATFDTRTTIRTSRFGDVHVMKGHYSSERSVAPMIARELLKEITKRNSNRRLPG